MNRLRAGGLALSTIGVVGFALLLAAGSIRHPAEAVARTHPAEFGAIAVTLLCLTVGVVLILTSYMEA